MNKDLVQIRIAQIDSDIQSSMDSINQLQANLHAMHGAKQDCLYWLQDCLYWLDELKKQEAAKPLFPKIELPNIHI